MVAADRGCSRSYTRPVRAVERGWINVARSRPISTVRTRLAGYETEQTGLLLMTINCFDDLRIVRQFSQMDRLLAFIVSGAGVSARLQQQLYRGLAVRHNGQHQRRITNAVLAVDVGGIFDQ